MPRKTVDCRQMPSESNCTLTISGEEGEVLRAATMHAVDVHGHTDTPELREQIRASMADEPAAMPGPSAPSATTPAEARH